MVYILMEKRRISKDLWCYVGDFNVIRLVEERYGRGFVKVEWYCSEGRFATF